MSITEDIIKHFPDFYEKDGDLCRLISVFAGTLEHADADLMKVMRAHWVDTADNEGSKGLNTAQKGDLDRVFSLYLANLGGTSLLKQSDRPGGDEGLESDAVYRDRLKGLIEILKSGPSTKKGITAIIAANLGIVGNDDKAKKAKSLIRIKEFNPEPVVVENTGLKLCQEFSIENPNPDNTVPEIRITIGMRGDTRIPLTNPRIVNITNSTSVEYKGTVIRNDVLSFFADGSAFLNGVKVNTEGKIVLQPGESKFCFEALVGYARGIFDGTLFNFSRFEDESLAEPEEEQRKIFELDIRTTVRKLNPGSFTVYIPWDIPGYTERIDRLNDDPRSQIKFIINRVKAAGVHSVIAYEKTFLENHDTNDEFFGFARRTPFIEKHEVADDNIVAKIIQKPEPIDHETSAVLTLSGVFDYTKFNSLNTFA